MRRTHRPLVALAVALLAALAAAACASANDDAVGTACKVIVEECGRGTTMGDCIDAVGSLPPACSACIAEQDCDYATCQRVPGCRLPAGLMGK